MTKKNPRAHKTNEVAKFAKQTITRSQLGAQIKKLNCFDAH